jgi:predicted nicotinamide N-methyase
MTFPTSFDDPPWAGLPAVPGGWMLQRVPVGDRLIELVQPAAPDDLLDDPTVIEANRRDDYMPYWSYLWPAATTMAAALARAPWPPETPVLELGCGVGLVGLAALARGWQVTLSDHDPVAVECALLNARRNELEERAAGLVLDWRNPVARRWPVILGCEVTYEVRNHPILLDLLEVMLTPDGVCWLGDPGRSQAPRFVALAKERGWRVKLLDHAAQPTETPPGETFQIVALRRPQPIE